MSPAPDSEFIGFGSPGRSRIDASQGRSDRCTRAVDHTRSDGFVTLSEGASIPDAKIVIEGMDGGSRIPIRNGKHPNRIIGANGQFMPNRSANGDRKAGIVSGMTRIVIARRDIGARDDRLDPAHATIAGQIVSVAVQPELRATVRLPDHPPEQRIRA